MRLPELCLALLCAAGSGTETPRAARERPPGPGRGEPGAARVDPRQAWMLLAGSPGRGGGERGRGGSGALAAAASPGSPGKTTAGPGAGPAAPAVPEELLRELQLLLRGTAKMCRTAGEGHKEEESSKGSGQARAQRRVEAAFHCQTRADIAVEQKTWQELGLFYIPEREEMFHRGPGLNLTSGQYTAPLAGFYTFSSTLHIARREPRRKRQGCRGSRLRVLICVQSCCQHNRYGRARPGPGRGEGAQHCWERRGCSPHHGPRSLQPSGERIPAGEQRGPFHHLCHRHPLPAGWAVCLCFCGQHGRLSPHSSKWLRFQCCSAGSVKRLNHAEPVPGAARPFPLPATIMPPLLSTKPKEEHLLMQGTAVWSDTARAAEPAEDGQKIMKERMMMMMLMMIVIKQPEQDLKAFTCI